MKPIIGIFPQLKDGTEAYIKPEYIRAIEESGGTAVLLPLAESENLARDAVDSCDGFVFAGGEDIEPERYGEKRLPVCGESVPVRDECEMRAISAVLASGKPMMGICRGFQLLNVALGGTLWQDLPSEFGSSVYHRYNGKETTHEIDIIRDTPLYRMLEKERTEINSFHHQAIRALAPDLAVMATADDGIVEAVCLRENPCVFGVQWHPERLFDGEDGKKIFSTLVASAVK